MKKPLDSLILTIRDQKVILDADLAELYGVPTKRLNEAVKRNSDRFPEDFLFRLTAAEKEQVVANCDHLARLKFSPQLPYAFTEHGAIMAATVLNSAEAVSMSVGACPEQSRMGGPGIHQATRAAHGAIRRLEKARPDGCHTPEAR